MLLAFEGVSRPVSLIDCDESSRDIAAVLRGWKIQETPDSPETPVIAIQKTESGYSRTSPWLSKPAIFPDKVDTVCDFLVDLVKAYLKDNPSLLCLHCAAVAFGQGLVVFPSYYRAGKSTLSIFLAAAGLRLFTDDVLMIEDADNRGVAPGVLPRLRLPLPEEAGGAFYRFVRDRTGLNNKRYLYVTLSEDEMAAFGTWAPVRGIVLLQREPGAKPELAPARTSEILKRAVLQNFARGVPTLDTLDRIHSIVAGTKCFTLRYAAGEQAATLLQEEFGREAEQKAPNG